MKFALAVKSVFAVKLALAVKSALAGTSGFAIPRCAHILAVLENSVTGLAVVFVLLSVTTVVRSGLLMVE